MWDCSALMNFFLLNLFDYIELHGEVGVEKHEI
jgi:hypothetical protein